MDRIKKLFILYVKMCSRPAGLGQDIGRPGPGQGPGKFVGCYPPDQPDQPERWCSGAGAVHMRIGAVSGSDRTSFSRCDLLGLILDGLERALDAA
jgi:hypothetical protein